MPHKRTIELYVVTMGFVPTLLAFWVTAQLSSGMALAHSPTLSFLASRQQSCPTDFKSLAENLAKDLRGYLNRAYMRIRSKSIVEAVGLPELEPLPLAAGDRTNIPSAQTNADPQQLFLTVLERKAGQVKTSETAYWLFMSYTRNGWRLAMAFTRVGNTPPYDVSDGVVANAVRIWLRDRCED